jgi:hypothetical protein
MHGSNFKVEPLSKQDRGDRQWRGFKYVFVAVDARAGAVAVQLHEKETVADTDAPKVCDKKLLLGTAVRRHRRSTTNRKFYLRIDHNNIVLPCHGVFTIVIELFFCRGQALVFVPLRIEAVVYIRRRACLRCGTRASEHLGKRTFRGVLHRFLHPVRDKDASV